MTNLPAGVLQKNAIDFTTEDGGAVAFAVRDGQIEVGLIDAEGQPIAGPLRVKSQVDHAMIQVLNAWRETKLTARPEQ